ncbi:hypothetical protein ADL26_00230 [Thermoactinomyces vulgaris]|jgi:hypothetical protein|uniref:Helix-turn-helix protein n=1 Tax=Laceyella sediminis TaxID=573074 RepID=A0ABX5EM28_9BACL|nr:hypothetical protein [Laceyella sediminis]KPC77705.1 hypothetical protein ADL26_00230 [Thermoactinomyces vulgaris]PRZ13005.1 hypothetical protein CLV36_11052 [Laceyella sediminis]
MKVQPYQAKLDQLTPRERQTYFELVRLAAPEEMIHPEYQVLIPKGACIISYRQLEKYLDLTRSTIRRALVRLADRDFIELTHLGQLKGKDGVHYRSMVKIKHYKPLPAHTEVSEQEPSLVEGLIKLEYDHLTQRFDSLQTYLAQNRTRLTLTERAQLDRIIAAYQAALHVVGSNKETFRR